MKEVRKFTNKDIQNEEPAVILAYVLNWRFKKIQGITVGFYFHLFTFSRLIDLKIEIRKTILSFKPLSANDEDISYFLVVKNILMATEKFPKCPKENPFACLVEISGFVHSVLGNEFASTSYYLVFSSEFYKEAKKFLLLDEIVSNYISDTFSKLLSPLMDLNRMYSGILAKKNIKTAISGMKEHDPMDAEKIEERLTVIDFKAFLENVESIHSNLKFQGGRFALKSKSEYGTNEINRLALLLFNDYKRVNILKGFPIEKEIKCKVLN